MTIIHPYFAIREGLLPEPQGFMEVMAMLRRESRYPAVCYGSVASGRPNLTSDFDVMFFVRGGDLLHEGSLTWLRLFAEEVMKKHRVHLNFRFVPTETASLRDHEVNNDLLMHVDYCARHYGTGFKVASGGIFGKRLVELRNRPFRDEAIEYIRRKFHVASEWEIYPHADSSDLRRRLAGSLDAPIHAARKMIECRLDTWPYVGTREQLLNRFSQLFPSGLSRLLFELDQAKSDYIEIINGCPQTEEEYGAELVKLLRDAQTKAFLFLDGALREDLSPASA